MSWRRLLGSAFVGFAIGFGIGEQPRAAIVAVLLIFALNLYADDASARHDPERENR